MLNTLVQLTIEAENFEVFKDIFTGLDEIEATLYYQIIRERIEE